MNWKAAQFALWAGILVLFLPQWLAAQAGTLAGRAADAAGKPIAQASVCVKNTRTGEMVETKSDAEGAYRMTNLAPGEYEVSIAAQGFAAKTAHVTLNAESTATLDATLQAAGPAELPNAPSSSQAPSLGDLGFTEQQTQGNPQLQALLQRRTEMLRIHQRLGLITTIPMAAAVITGPMAKTKGKNGQTITEPTQANLDFHAALGATTVGLYFSTAYFAVFAPKAPGTTKHGAIRLHEALAFVHGPGMILTPVLGAMAYKQENAGEKVHGIASAHGAVAYMTAAAYGASIVAVSWPIHVKFWEKP